MLFFFKMRGTSLYRALKKTGQVCIMKCAEELRRLCKSYCSIHAVRENIRCVTIGRGDRSILHTIVVDRYKLSHCM